MSDLEAKVKGMTARILAGNGFTRDEIELTAKETQELTVEGKLKFSTLINTEKTTIPGAVGHAEIVPDATTLAKKISEYETELNSTTPWLDEVKPQLAQHKYGGWGLLNAVWPVKRLDRRFAVILTCDSCKGKKTLTCAYCQGRGHNECQRCRIQWSGQQPGQIQCPDCLGTRQNPQNPAQPCLRCTAFTPGFVQCPDCGGRTTLACTHCHSRGHIDCKACKAKGSITEETALGVAVKAEFELGQLANLPPGVFELIDRIPVETLAEQHATVTPDASDIKTGLAYKANMPYTRFILKAGEQTLEFGAVGKKPLLVEFPTLLDDSLREAAEKLSPATLPSLAQKYRLFGELAGALAGGTRPADFYRKNYPYGISREFALDLAKLMGMIFGAVTQRPRAIAGAVGALIGLGLFATWLKLNLAAKISGIQPQVAHIALALVLATLIWFAVDMTGRQTLAKLMPKSAKVTKGNAGLIGLAATLLFLAGAAALVFSGFLV